MYSRVAYSVQRQEANSASIMRYHKLSGKISASFTYLIPFSRGIYSQRKEFAPPSFRSKLQFGRAMSIRGSIGVGRFRIFGGQGLEYRGEQGGQIPSRHMTS